MKEQEVGGRAGRPERESEKKRDRGQPMIVRGLGSPCGGNPLPPCFSPILSIFLGFLLALRRLHEMEWGLGVVLQKPRRFLRVAEY